MFSTMVLSKEKFKDLELLAPDTLITDKKRIHPDLMRDLKVEFEQNFVDNLDLPSLFTIEEPEQGILSKYLPYIVLGCLALLLIITVAK